MRKILILIALLGINYLHAQTPIGSPFTTTNENEWMGWDVDISRDGTVIAISSIAYPDYDSPDGTVRLYRRAIDQWEQIGEDIRVEEANNSFGYSIALSEDGNTLAIGMPSHDEPYGGCGAVKIYTVSDTDEIESTGFIKGTEPSQGIGFSVDLSFHGDVLIMGSQDTEYGIVQVFEKQNEAWQLKGNKIVSEVYGDKFGFNVVTDSSGNTIAAIAPSLGVLNGAMPNIKVFGYENSEWQINENTVTSANYGTAVQYFALSNSGDLIAVKNKDANFGKTSFYKIEDNQLELLPEFISGAVDFNLNPEGNILSIGKKGQLIAIEGSNKIDFFEYNDNEWINKDKTIASEKVIHNMKISEDGQHVILSYSGIDYSDKEVVVYQLDVLNTTTEQDKSPLSFYPNPVFSELLIEMEGFNYTILEASTGKLLKSGYADDSTINVDALKPGTYILSVRKGDETESLKFIKQ